jgi:hypothetical protein
MALELVYRGLDSQGLHEWEATADIRSGDSIHIDVMPARSTIVYRCIPPSGQVETFDA